MQKLESFLRKNQISSPISWLLGLSGIIAVRFFLEAISNPSSSGVVASDASTLIHYYVFFVCFALGSLLFFSFALPRWRNLVPQLVLFLFLSILLGPILDFCISKGAGIRMAYLIYPAQDLWHAFWTFFGPFGNGITPGIRIEAVIIVLLSAFLIQKIEKSWKRTIISGLILYAAIFIFLSMPSFLGLFSSIPPISLILNTIINSATLSNNLHGTLLYAYPERVIEIGFNFLIGRVFFLLLSIFGIIWFFISEKAKALSIFKNSRPERVAFHLLAVCLGIGLAWLTSYPGNMNWNDMLSLITLLTSFYFSWMFAVCVNDVVDEDIDAVSNQARPLIKGSLSVSDLKQTSYLFLITSLIGAFLAGYYPFFCLLAFTALYFIYSAPPTRFKRIPFFSSLLIAFCVLSEVMAGFFFFSHSKVLSTFPNQMIILIVLFAFLWSHVRDLKDIEGDRAAGIPTVPVLFGTKIVALFASIAFLLIPLFLAYNLLWIPSILAALATYYFCLQKPYKEFPLFLTYFLFLIAAGLILFL